MVTSALTLVLFDIDGTLVQTGRAGVRGMNQAFVELFGVDNALDGVPVAGRTDRAIVAEALARAGQPDDLDTITRVREYYCRRLPAAMADPASRPMSVLPGVLDLLGELDARSDVVTGLLTGNFASGAAIKLGHFDLWTRFRFGAFGDHHAERRALVADAVVAAAEHGHPDFAPDRIVIIGDTPLDVDCAHAYGARAIAVATGMYPRDVLEQTGADLTVTTLADVPHAWFC
jgi:phosphoglycolate phosphatase-like HAD superfamily hydrolase